MSASDKILLLFSLCKRERGRKEKEGEGKGEGREGQRGGKGEGRGEGKEWEGRGEGEEEEEGGGPSAFFSKDLTPELSWGDDINPGTGQSPHGLLWTPLPEGLHPLQMISGEHVLIMWSLCFQETWCLD